MKISKQMAATVNATLAASIEGHEQAIARIESEPGPFNWTGSLSRHGRIGEHKAKIKAIKARFLTASD